MPFSRAGRTSGAVEEGWMARSESTLQRYFAPCPRGLEECLANELAAQGAGEIETVPGGAHFAGDWACCYRVNLHSRIATRVLWRVGHERYRTESDVHRAVFQLPWWEWFDPRWTIRVYVTAIHSPLRSLEYITVHIKDALCARFSQRCGMRPSVDTEQPEIRVHAFLDARAITLYVDTSGEPLYKRGYRQSANEAPLKENLAAGLILLAGWEPGMPFLDPMCGSGTLLMEAAQMALNIPAGGAREFGFQRLIGFQRGLWERMRNEALAAAQEPRPLPIFGSDLHHPEIRAAVHNLEAAGLREAVRLKQADILRLSKPAETGVMVTNPPYGVRLGEQEQLEEFYPKLGDALKRSFAGWTCAFLSGDPEMPRRIGLKPTRRIPLFNGALECRLLLYKMVSGELRPRGEDPASPTEPAEPAESSETAAAGPEPTENSA